MLKVNLLKKSGKELVENIKVNLIYKSARVLEPLNLSQYGKYQHEKKI